MSKVRSQYLTHVSYAPVSVIKSNMWRGCVVDGRIPTKQSRGLPPSATPGFVRSTGSGGILEPPPPIVTMASARARRAEASATTRAPAST